MNKTELVAALAARLGDRKLAKKALDAVITEIQRAVVRGDRVTIPGFGVFERRLRESRTARPPDTGTAVTVKDVYLPAFRPASRFKEQVARTAVSEAAGTLQKAGAPRKAAAQKRTVPQRKAPRKKVARKLRSDAIEAGPPPGPGFPTDPLGEGERRRATAPMVGERRRR